MYSIDNLNLTAYRRKLSLMMYKPIIAPLLPKRALFASGGAAVRAEREVGRTDCYKKPNTNIKMNNKRCMVAEA